MFVKGSEPFIGDYIDVAGDPPFILNNGKWGFNTTQSESAGISRHVDRQP